MIKKMLFLLVFVAGSVRAFPFDSYIFWVDGDKVSVADVRAEVDDVKKGEVDNLNLLLNESVIRQLDFPCGRFEQIELLQDLIQYLRSKTPDPKVEAMCESRLNYLLKWEDTYPKVKESKESYTDAREVFETACIKLIWVLHYKSHHLSRAERMLRIRHLLGMNYEVYPLRADLWRLMLSVSVRDHLKVAISDESVGRLLAIDDEDKEDLFSQVLGAVSSLCRLIDNGSNSYKKCDHYELWIRFRDIYSGAAKGADDGGSFGWR